MPTLTEPVGSSLTALPSLPLAISDWTPLKRNTLIGSFNVHLPDGMTISGCLLHRTGDQNEPRIALPGAAQVDRDELKRSAEGRILYRTIIQFNNKERYRRFAAPILEELKRMGHI